MNTPPTDWLDHLPDVVYFVIGLGAFSGAVFMILKLWRAIVPDDATRLTKDVDAIKSDVRAIRERVARVELDVAKIDYSGMTARFDGIEKKIDGLFTFLLERFSNGSTKIRPPGE